MTTEKRSAIPLQTRVTCPHCWSAFPPDQVLWIAQHPDLVGDVRLGKDQAQRFLPTRFNVAGAAIDARGFACHELACANCHLPVPRALIETPPVFISILGAPACGKSYFLASMSWRLRKVLPKYFALGCSDADPTANRRLVEYENLQFLNPNQNELVAIEKTETHGDYYDTVLYEDQAVNYPRPFLFSVTPQEAHPNRRAAAKASCVLCLYDNAGESFLPGSDTATNPVTRHLLQSRALVFLFDPTQDIRFRQACQGKTNDPQMTRQSQRLQRESPVRQETILAEAAQRVRRFAGLPQHAKHSRPLVVAVTKYDCWSSLLGAERLDHPWVAGADGSVGAMNLQQIEGVSRRLRDLLRKLSPEIVSTAESFAQQVVYVPVSATGCSPEVHPETGAFCVRPRNIRPMWSEVPLLYVMCRWMEGLVPYLAPKSQAKEALPRSHANEVSPQSQAKEAWSYWPLPPPS